MTRDATPSVSVVLVNYRGCRRHPRGHQELVRASTGPGDRLEIIVVDNASGDDSADSDPTRAFHTSKVSRSGTQPGFAGGCNLGVVGASGHYLAFLNNDARPHPEWIRAPRWTPWSGPDGSVAWPARC